MSSDMKKTFASLFTGGGLADVGAIAAGFDLTWGIEINPDIAAIARKNLNHNDGVYADSVVGFDWGSVSKVDHLHMSPPCQDFSIAKTTGDVVNQNGDLSDACVQAILTLKPSSVTLENVEGYRKSAAFHQIVDVLWGSGYWVDVQVLNSADFGVPQTRRRLILRAVLGGFPLPLPPPTDWLGWYDAIADLIPSLPDSNFAPWQRERLPEVWKTCLVECSQSRRTATTRCPESPSPTLTVSSVGRPSRSLKALVVDGKANGNGERLTAITGDRPMFTVQASSSKQAIKAALVPGGNSSSFSVREAHEPSRTIESTKRVGNIPKAALNSPLRVVRLTPRALARLQTVPDWYELPKKRLLACKIIGNGVPCLMMQRVLESI